MNGVGEKREGRMDWGGGGPLFKEVRLHKRGEMGNKRLGALLPWQAIHPGSEVLQKRKSESGRGVSKPHINSPAVSGPGLSSAEYQQPGKASCLSVNWTMGDTQLEVVSTATGRRRESGTPSRLCKHALFTRWSRLYRKLGIHVSGSTDDQLLYCEAKMAARPYQTVKQQWFRSLQETGLGTWVKKPPEQEQFLLASKMTLCSSPTSCFTTFIPRSFNPETPTPSPPSFTRIERKVGGTGPTKKKRPTIIV
ncbi:unnamed protein product [Pleuronectes platessa]|uniref:A to I editase domain-containing protein n=1 Tax=Pleuronectes platessa TaxID=8262 RepID=A0A9N7VID4_PLEPL|nr:unnamed protein product [Pleuronectes platessa]